MITWTDEYITMLDDCKKCWERLTDWERKFVDSLRQQINDGYQPSAKQIEKLDSCWERVTQRGFGIATRRTLVNR